MNTSKDPSVGDMVGEIVPLVDAIAGYGPPVILVGGPWLLLGLVLTGPFTVLVIVVAFMVVAATVVVALPAAILFVPYLLVRRRRGQRGRDALSGDHVVQLIPAESRRVVA